MVTGDTLPRPWFERGGAVTGPSCTAASHAAALFESLVDLARADLLAIRQKLTPNGFIIHLPQTPDGRHADYAPSVTMALSKCLCDPEDLGPLPGTPEYYALQERQLEERLFQSLDDRYQQEQEERRYWRDFYGVRWP